MRSQQHHEENCYRAQQWGHARTGEEGHRRQELARPRNRRKSGPTGSLDRKNTTSYRLSLGLGLRGVRGDFPQ